MIEQGPTWLAVGSPHAVKRLEISYRGSMQSDLEAWYSQADLPMNWVACIDETTTGPVSPNGYYLYGWPVGPPLTCYR